MLMANMDVREALKTARIPYWRLGIEWGCSEVTVVRRLRIELCEDEKQKIYKMICKIKKMEK